MEPITIKPPSEQESEEAQQLTSTVVANAKALRVKTREDLGNVAAEALSQVKKQYTVLESKRKAMKQPTLQAAKQIDEFFKPFLSQLKEAEDIIKQTMLQAKAKFDQEDAEREAKITARVEKEGRGRLTEETGINKISEIDRVEKKIETSSGGYANFKKVKQVTVTDLNDIPRDYLMPKDPEEFADFKPWPAIRSAAIKLYELQQAGHNIKQIAGIEVMEVDSLAAR